MPPFYVKRAEIINIHHFYEHKFNLYFVYSGTPLDKRDSRPLPAATTRVLTVSSLLMILLIVRASVQLKTG